MAAPTAPHAGYEIPPPRTEVGVIGWLTANLFSTWYNAALTLIAGAAIILALWYGLSWVFAGADWTVIAKLGGRFVIGQYNTDAACAGNNCFWRPQAALLLVIALLGMAWGLKGNAVAHTGHTLSRWMPLGDGRQIATVKTAIFLLALGMFLLTLVLLWNTASISPLRQAGLAVLGVIALLGVAWQLEGNPVARNIAVGVTAAAAAFAFLPYSMERMGLDVRLLLLANIPALFIGYALARWTPLGTGLRITIAGVVIFLLTLVLLRGLPLDLDWRLLLLVVILAQPVGYVLNRFTPLGKEIWITITVVAVFATVLTLLQRLGVPGMQPVGVIYWGGLMLNLILAVGGITLSLPIGIALALGRRSNLSLPLYIPLAALYGFTAALGYAGVLAGGFIPLFPIVLPAILLIISFGIAWSISRGNLMALLIANGISLGFGAILGGTLAVNLDLALPGLITLLVLVIDAIALGVVLASGRSIEFPVVKALCVTFIEVFRGVPLITLLFMSQVLVPLAFPQDFPLNSLLRAGIIITMFSAAYMAENIRGGLQALHPGQAEAARALGLAGWQTTLLISLPQAIRNVIPAIVGQFIGLFKDTSLVYIIAMLDIVETGRTFILGNPEYLQSAREMFVFVALVFWIFTYGMSYVSSKVEESLGVGQR